MKMITSLVVIAHWDRSVSFGGNEHDNSAEIVMMHTDISTGYFHAPSKEWRYVGLSLEREREVE